MIHDETRIYGDGINVAARLEGIAEPGGICISRQVFDQVNPALKADFQALGPRTFKNIGHPVDVFAISPSDHGARPGVAAPNPVDLKQETRFCTAPDGVQLAYSMIGRGPSLMKTGNWMTHLEFDLDSPIWRHLYRELAKDHTLIRYDARGNGLSDRAVDEISFDAFVSDLEAVVDAARVARFALLGISRGLRGRDRLRGAPSQTGLTPHPLWRLRDGPEQARAQCSREGGRGRHADADARGLGKGEPGVPPAVHLPVHTRRDQGAGRLVQRAAADHGLGEMAARISTATGEIDVNTLLPRVSMPTLVLHAREDARVPFEAGRRMAAGIPGARFVALPGRNHLFLETEPAFGQFLEETRAFLAS